MPVVAERVGNRIYLRVPYSPENVERCKSVIGGRWSKNARAWTYPLDIEVARMLRSTWGPSLQLGPELTAWGKAETEREASLVKYVDVKDIDVMAEVHLEHVSKLAPAMWTAMRNRPYQPVASQYMAMARRSLCGDQPGVGKTIESLGALLEAGLHHGRVLILAPKKSTSVVWEPEIERWLDDYEHGFTVTRVSGMSPAKMEEAISDYDVMAEDHWGLHFLIANAEVCRIKKDTVCPDNVCDGDEDWCPEKDRHVNRSTVRQQALFNLRWDAIIADETHKWLINTRGKQASQVGYGFTKLPDHDDQIRIALTGTPLKGKKYNLFGTLNWLRPKVFTSKWRWIEQYFPVEKNEWGGRMIGESIIPERKESFFRALNGVMIRRTKSELHRINPAWMPPDKIYHDLVIPMDDAKQRKGYDSMFKDAAASLPGGRLTAIGVLPELTRLKQFAQCSWQMEGGTIYPILPSNKFEWILEFLEERGIEQKTGRQRRGDLSEDVHKVVIASQFTKIIDMYALQLRNRGIDCFTITGHTKDADATNIVQRWADMTDPVRVCLINTQAGGVSITLDAADDLIVHDETWVPDEQEQVEDRVHRASRTDHQVDIWYIRSEGTLEAEIAADNMSKAEGNHVVLDANRGMQFAYDRMSKVIAEREKSKGRKKR